MKPKRDLLRLTDLTAKEIERLFNRTATLKKERQRRRFNHVLKGRTLAMLFEKASTRTRVSFEIAMRELGGDAVFLEGSSTQIGRGETYADTAMVLSRYAHGIMIRTYGHTNAEELALHATIPVINGLTDLYHPCQILADLFTIRECKKKVRKICYIGDGNNMANTWMEASALLGVPLTIATPPGFAPPDEILKKDLTRSIVMTQDPVEAVRDADVVNTDTWFSMGQEETEAKRKAFGPYQVNRELLKEARPDAIVLHCLPAHRGQEITDEVMDGPQARIWQQAENRLHVQKAILEMLMK